jgi:hypothetical protein
MTFGILGGNLVVCGLELVQVASDAATTFMFVDG